MINSVLNEGVKGMQTSARDMQKAAHEIAQFNVREDSPTDADNPLDQSILPAEATGENAKPGNIAEPIVELKRQELLFTASAQIVKVADDALGSLLSIRS